MKLKLRETVPTMVLPLMAPENASPRMTVPAPLGPELTRPNCRFVADPVKSSPLEGKAIDLPSLLMMRCSQRSSDPSGIIPRYDAPTFVARFVWQREAPR